jgi:hypothetical protein
MTKKTRDAVVSITAAEVEALSTNGKVNILFYGDLESTEGQIINNLAKLDDHNCTIAIS